jgi:hypothetical protein
LEHLDSYVRGTPFEVLSAAKPSMGVFYSKNASRRELVRWLCGGDKTVSVLLSFIAAFPTLNVVEKVVVNQFFAALPA